MRLIRIRLTDFKRHAQLEIEPAAGLTIVRGPNEAGKSTILEALRLVLYRKADSNREDVRQAMRWGAGAAPEVTVELEADGHQVRLVKRFAGPRGEAELVTDHETIRDHGLIAERIAELTGVPSEGFFRVTAAVAHAELADVAGAEEPAMSDRLQKAVSGADRGTARAKRKLDTAIHRYRTEGQKNPGLLKAVRDEILELEGELLTGEQSLARLEADRAQLAEAQARRSALEVQLTRQQADLVEARRAEALAKQRDETQARYDQLKRAAELVAEADRLTGEMPTATPLGALRTTVNRATTLSYELSEVEADLGAGGAAVADGGTAPPPRPALWLILAVGLLLVGVLAWLVVGDVVGGVLALAFVLAAFGALIQTVRLALRGRQHGYALQLAADAAARRQEADVEQHERLRRRRRELEALLGSIGLDDVGEAQELLAAVELRTDRLAHIEGELRGMGVEDRNIRRLEEERDAAADATEQARHALAGMGEPSEDPATRRQLLERLVEQSLPARDRARSEEDQARGRVDANLVDAEIIAGLAERCAAARARETELVRRLRIYEATRTAIDAAEQATLKTAARYLEEHMGPAVARITDGRYDEVRVDERSLAFTVRTPETGQLIDVGQLSRGTADQLFLAARLGLVRLVTLDRRPPLLLDDPFVTFDAERAARAVQLLKEAAAEQGFQVILLTCSDGFDALADSVVVLDGPAAIPAGSRPLEAPAPEVRTAAPEMPEVAPAAPGPRSRQPRPRRPRCGPRCPSRGQLRMARWRPIPRRASWTPSGSAAAEVRGNHLESLAPLLAVASAASWGAGDFAGGIATRLSRSSVTAVLLAQLTGLVVAFGLLVASGEPMPGREALLWGAAAGVSGSVGLGAFYLALSRGTMGLVAPFTALIAAAVPAITGIAGGDAMGSLALAGMGMALIAVVLISLPDRRFGSPALPTYHGSRAREWLLIVIGGLGFSGFFLCIHASHEAGGAIWWPLVLVKLAGATSVGAVILGVAASGRTPVRQVGRAAVVMAGLAGLGDLGGNLFFVLASDAGELAVVVVISSLYPVSTALLARAFLHERLGPVRLAGAGLAVASVVLIGLGSL